MVDQNALTVFVALTTVAVLIQTGILVGFFFLSTKLSRQVDQALDSTRNVLGPLESAAENLKAVTAVLSRFSSETQGQLREQLERWGKRQAA
jgi:hypothetical protein